MSDDKKALYNELRTTQDKLNKLHRDLKKEMPLIIGKRYLFGDDYWELREVHYRDCVLESAFGSRVTVSTDQLEWAVDR